MFAKAHRNARWLTALSIAAAVFAHLPPALADSPSDEGATEQRRSDAKAKYQQGAEAYTAGHFKDAVDLFLAADRLAPSAPLSFNIARAYEKLGDDAGALRWYRDYLRRNPAAANASTVAALITSLAHSLQKKGVQQLSVLTSPAGATVSVDDQPVGVTPWTGELSPGNHHLLLSQRGYSDAELDISLLPDQPLDATVRLEQRNVVTEAPSTPAAAPSAAEPSSLQPARGEPPHGKRLGLVPWITLGAGGAALGGALTFELLRRGAQSDAEQQTTQLGYQDRLNAEQSRQTTARILLGAGGALLAAGGLMLLLDTDGSSHGTSAGVLCIPGTCAVTARGKF